MGEDGRTHFEPAVFYTVKVGKEESAVKPENLEKINRSFEIQAPSFESKAYSFSKETYLKEVLACIQPHREDVVLEVAAGTCACGRAFAPLVQSVVCLDATASMLQIGRQEADRGGLHNLLFVKGYAQELPFLEGSFDIVFSRLAFHHFPDREPAFSEMVRVVKPGGRVVMIDMEAADEPLRETEDAIERMRDPSHVRNLSKAEMKGLFAAHHLAVDLCETTQMPQRLESWLSLTKTPPDVRQEVARRMQTEINGGEKTGFMPYLQDNAICFHQRWVLISGHKEGEGQSV